MLPVCNSKSSIAYPSPCILAATRNDELAYLYGDYMADQCHNRGISGWYAPAMDMHRTAFSGRNFEYYSEDSVLSGGIGASTVAGARSKGLIVYIKHFALNDQETHRARVHTYSNEQAIREIYLKPFEDSVKDGGATGIMTAMNYIGDVYCGAHEPLMMQVTRNEWGFRGAIISDMDEGGENRSSDACVRAGLDAWLPMAPDLSTESNADIYYMQRMLKNILYTDANALITESELLPYMDCVNAVYVELAVLCLACVIGFVVQTVRDKKKAVV